VNHVVSQEKNISQFTGLQKNLYPARETEEGILFRTSFCAGFSHHHQQGGKKGNLCLFSYLLILMQINTMNIDPCTTGNKKAPDPS
jgi:hypothetical protein